MRAGLRRRAVGVALALACIPGCKRKHVPVDAVPELGYPVCGDGGSDEPGTVEADGRLRAGPLSAEKNVVETYSLRRTSCGYTFRSRQEWPLAIADVEVRYDASYAPTWVDRKAHV